MKNYNFQLVYKKYNKKKTLAKNIVSLIFLALLAIIVLLYTIGNLNFFQINGWSAEPYHHYGSLAIDYKVPFDKLKAGDFITWSKSGGRGFVTHQIIEINEENKTVITCQQSRKEDGTFKTIEELLNDASVSKDGEITEDIYYGKVIFSIPNVGSYMSDIKNMVIQNGAINIIGIITILLMGLAYYLFTKCLNKETYILMGR